MGYVPQTEVHYMCVNVQCMWFCRGFSHPQRLKTKYKLKKKTVKKRTVLAEHRQQVWLASASSARLSFSWRFSQFHPGRVYLVFQFSYLGEKKKVSGVGVL